MRCVRLHEDGLRIDEVPVPVPRDDEVLVEVAAIGVTLPGVRVLQGNGVELPHAPGGDLAGRVRALGANVSGVDVGDRVAGVAFTGGYAEFATLPTALAHPIPSTVDDLAAVALVRGGQVALGALRASGFAAGERVLVTGAAGGVGHLAVQAAVALGASHVVGAVGSADKAEFVRELGAHSVIDYAEEDWGEPVDVVLDGVGGQAFAGGLRTLAPFGRLVTFNAVGGTVEVNELRMHSRSVIGFAMAHLAARRPETYRRRQHELWELCAGTYEGRSSIEGGGGRGAGKLAPRVQALPLEQAAEAHRLISSRRNLGKIALTP